MQSNKENTNRTFLEEWNGPIVLLVNLAVLAGFGWIFFSGLYGMQEAVVFHTALAKSSPGAVFIDPFHHLSAEQRIDYLLEAMKYQFWMFFLLSVRFAALIWITIRAQVVSSLSLIASVVIFFVYHTWSSRVDDFSLLMFVPKWVWGTLMLAIYIAGALDIIFWVILWRRRARQGRFV